MTYVKWHWPPLSMWSILSVEHKFAHLQHGSFLRGLKMHLVLITEAIDSWGSLCGCQVHWQHEVTGFNRDIGKAFSEVQDILNSIQSACNNSTLPKILSTMGHAHTANLDLLWKSNSLHLFSIVAKVKSCLVSSMFSQNGLTWVSVYLSLNIKLLAWMKNQSP